MSEKIPINIDNTKEAELMPEIAELERPIRVIIDKVRNRIESGEYGLIIGDDASARIPTRILGEFIQRIAEKRSNFKPKIIFIPGKLGVRETSFEEKELEEFFKEHGFSQNKRILIVTDTVRTGESLASLAQIIKNLGYECDIATIGIEDEQDKNLEKERKINLREVEVFSGEYSTGGNIFFPNTPNIYDRKDLSGVSKRSGDLRSTPLKLGQPDSETKEQIQESINRARKDAHVVADHLIDWYENRDNE